jgi:polysaccharide biosynthesis/export protein
MQFATRPPIAILGALAVVALVAAAALAQQAQTQQQDYLIGHPDVLRIVVWGHDDLSKDYPVDADGLVPFPLVGRVNAAGLTPRDFARNLAAALEKDYLVDPQVIVSVKEYRSKKVHVVGEAEKPGLFYLSGHTTLLDIISRAGGLSRNAGKQLLVVRNNPGGQAGPRGTAILRVDFNKIQAGTFGENLAVEDEDMIFVPKGQAFFVLGEVKKAGTFPLEKPTTVLEAITLAEGYTDKAAPSAVKVIRRSADGKEDNISLDLSGAIPKDRDFRIEDGDSVLVPRGNTFFVFGEVKRPGAYQLDREMNILEGITMAGGFTDKAAPGRTKVIRYTPKGQQTIDVDMNEIVKRGRREKAIALQENDVIVVPESFF